GWMRFGFAISRVTTPLILSLVFFLVFMPAGLIMRIAGHDPMRRRLSADSDSYREPSRTATPESMQKPY
ncbi:MAG: SxtJ family membrane protein, partial [Thiohalocapsa sp.]